MIKRLLLNQVFLQSLFLIVVTTVAYHAVFAHGFLYFWDDQWQVINPMTEKGFGWDNLKLIFGEPLNGQYSPVNQLYYTLIYSLWGYKTITFHAGNLLFHLLTVFAVYYLVVLILRKAAYSDKEAYLIAFIAALLFAIHPVNAEPVCWISASKVVIGTFFYLLAIIVYIRYVTDGKKILFAASVICAFLSGGYKEQVVTLWATLLLFDWLILRRNMKNVRVYVEKLFFLLPALLIFIVTFYINRNTGEDIVGYTLIDRFFLFSYSLFDYMWLSVFPFKLSYLYPYPFQVGESIPVKLWLYPAIIIFIGYGVFLLRKQPFVLFSFLFFLLNLLPVLHVVPLPRYALVADRYLYLPYIACAFLSAVYLYKLFVSKQYKTYLIVFVFYCLYLFCYTWTYSQVWRDSDKLKQGVTDILIKRKSLAN